MSSFIPNILNHLHIFGVNLICFYNFSFRKNIVLSLMLLSILQILVLVFVRLFHKNDFIRVIHFSFDDLCGSFLSLALCPDIALCSLILSGKCFCFSLFSPTLESLLWSAALSAACLMRTLPAPLISLWSAPKLESWVMAIW